jgi:YD repeat-containing protein
MTRRLDIGIRVVSAALGLAAIAIPGGALGSGVFGYDKVGRVTTALYDNGTCLVYTYDANGNRTSQTNTPATVTAVWGSGVFGCFSWTP